MTDFKNKIKHLFNISLMAIFVGIIIALSFYGGHILLHHFDKSNTMPTVDRQTDTIRETVHTVAGTKTQIVYVPKETVVTKYIDDNGITHIQKSLEKTDLQVNTGKPDFNIKVNGHEATFHKADNEKYMFEKNKLEMNQQSTIDMNIKVPPIDDTKYYGIGAGYNSKNGVNYILTFPINKSKHAEGYVTHDKKSTTCGVILKF